VWQIPGVRKKHSIIICRGLHEWGKDYQDETKEKVEHDTRDWAGPAVCEGKSKNPRLKMGGDLLLVCMRKKSAEDQKCARGRTLSGKRKPDGEEGVNYGRMESANATIKYLNASRASLQSSTGQIVINGMRILVNRRRQE